MSTAQVFEQPESNAAEYHYRALSTHAVTSFILGVLSVLAFLGPLFALLCLLGILCGIYGIMQIRSRPLELAGFGLAVAGVLLSGTTLVASLGLFTYTFLTEVPDGYQRTYWSQLQPEEGVMGQKMPPFAETMNGKDIFTKGYIFPGPREKGIKTFLLVRDKGDCCFGGDPKITDRIQVTLDDSRRLTFTARKVKVWGSFRLEEIASTVGTTETKGGVYYHIDNAQWSR